MLGIRSVTYHLPAGFSVAVIENIGNIILQWNKFYSKIRTQRMALPTVSVPLDDKFIRQIEVACNNIGLRWFNIPVDPHTNDNGDRQRLFNHAYNILSDFPNAFVCIIGLKNNKIDFDILERSAKLVQRTSTLSSNGSENFRLGVAANVKPNGPFFPFTMSSGEFGFSIALELTQEINYNISDKEVCSLPLTKLKDRITDFLKPQIEDIGVIAEKISTENNLKFQGFDFSLAPIIEDNGSIFPILKSFGMSEFGAVGSMFATAFMTDILKSFGNDFKMVGFSGVMYSLLEDFEFCSINNRKTIAIEDLIAVSTQCGCGVDMIPVYGNISVEELLAIFLDISAVSCRLNKPLGVRILPIPRTQNNQEQYTIFNDNAEFISNTKVVGIKNIAHKLNQKDAIKL